MTGRRERGSLRVIVDAVPTDTSIPGERSRWEAFKDWLFVKFRKGEHLGERAGDAEVERREAEARKAHWEAEAARLQVVDKFFELADKAHSPEDADDLRELKKAALLQAHPEIEEKYRELAEKKLQLENKGVEFKLFQSGDRPPEA